jgi:hypothetical protein
MGGAGGHRRRQGKDGWEEQAVIAAAKERMDGDGGLARWRSSRAVQNCPCGKFLCFGFGLIDFDLI